ncbi:MAG: nucleotide sugar dehydrogenase [Hyphomicrobiaceae bacterium]
MLPKRDDLRIAVVGLGYVGLPLAIYLARRFPVIGFDVNTDRIAGLEEGFDRTGEVTDEEFASARSIEFTADPQALSDCNFYVVTVPTPIDAAKRPDLTALQRASETVGRSLAPGNIVVYESTVFPGATEDECVPILERVSGLVFNKDFYAGYSPERINPGDMEHRLPDIAKVTSGSTPEVADLVDWVYGEIITAGTHKASSIKVAEAAKVIENIQRDVNIALINELAQLFKQLGLDTDEVLQAAGTKWNFHRTYRPGLVGGHCIGVDPYYLTHKAQSIGFHTEMILAGRRINDGMAHFVAHDIIKSMIRRKQRVDTAHVLVLGFTFKENCPDLRNTKVAELVSELDAFTGQVDVYDPHAIAEEAIEEYGITIVNEVPDKPYDAIVLAVKHREIVELGHDRLRAMLTEDGLIYDIKGILEREQSDARI